MSLVYAEYVDDGQFLPRVLEKYTQVKLVNAVDAYRFFSSIDQTVKYNKWLVIEGTSGSLIAKGKTQKEAIAKATDNLVKYKTVSNETIAPFIEKFRDKMLTADPAFYQHQNLNMSKSKKTAAVATAPAPKKPACSLDQNLKYLRETLSVETLLDDINQDEALEFLNAVEADIYEEREAYQEAETELKELEEKQSDFKHLMAKLKDLDSSELEIDDLLDFVNDTDSDAIREFLKGQNGDFITVQVQNLAQRQKLEEFLTTVIYPNYTDQQSFLEL